MSEARPAGVLLRPSALHGKTRSSPAAALRGTDRTGCRTGPRAEADARLVPAPRHAPSGAPARARCREKNTAAAAPEPFEKALSSVSPISLTGPPTRIPQSAAHH